MFDIHVPSNRIETIQRLVPNFLDLMASDGFRLCLNLQFKKHTKEYEIAEGLLSGWPTYIKGFIQEPTDTPSMFKLRRQITEAFPERSFMIFDCDDLFKEGSAKYYIECFNVMQDVKKRYKRPTFFGTTGFLGSSGPGGPKDKIHVPLSPLMASNMGLIFDRDIELRKRKDLDWILAGLEEGLMCALSMKMHEAIPLKRFLCPTYKKRRTRKNGKADESYIHNQKRIMDNAVPVIRELADFEDWTPPFENASVKHSPKYFIECARRMKETIDIIQPKDLS